MESLPTLETTHDEARSASNSRHETDNEANDTGSDTVSQPCDNAQDEGCNKNDINEEVPTLFSSTDILRIKNRFLENVEELRILRVSGTDNEQRINDLVEGNHDMERKMEDVVSATDNQQEQHERDIAEVRKQMEQKMHKLEAEKNQTTLKTDMWEKEVKALKEEVRNLLVTKYSLEKTVKEQEHRIQMQSSAGDSHMSQMNALEGRCKDLVEDYNNFREQLGRLGNEVKCATDINNKLSRVNNHQQCIITSLTEENQKKQTHIISIKAKCNNNQHEGGIGLLEKNAMIQRLKEDVENKMKINQHLEDQIIQFKDGHQRTLSSLSESDLLADRHLNSSLKSAEEVNRLTKELKETKNKFVDTEEQLASCRAELESVKKQNENVESDLETKIEEAEVNIQQIKKEHDDMSQAYHNLEELNSSWAKKNKEMTTTIQQLTDESDEKTKQLDDRRIQIATLSRRPETCDTSTSTEVLEDIKLSMKEASSQTVILQQVSVSVQVNEEKALKFVEDISEKVEENKSAINKQSLSKSISSAAEPINLKDAIPVDCAMEVNTTQNPSEADEQDTAAKVEQECLSQLGSSRPLFDRCLKKMPTDKVADFKSDIGVKLREEKKTIDISRSVNKNTGLEDVIKQSLADSRVLETTTAVDIDKGSVWQSENVFLETPLVAENEASQQKTSHLYMRKVSEKASDKGYKKTEHSLTEHSAVISVAKSTPSVVINEAGQMFLSTTVQRSPAVRKSSPGSTESKYTNVSMKMTSEDPALTRFKGLAHLTSPPLLSSPIVRRVEQVLPLPSPGGRYSFKLSSFSGMSSADKAKDPSNIKSNPPSTPRREGTMLKPPSMANPAADTIMKSPRPVTNQIILGKPEGAMFKPSNLERSASSTVKSVSVLLEHPTRDAAVFRPGSRMPPESSPYRNRGLANLNLTFPTSSGDAMTSQSSSGNTAPSMMSSAKWFTKAGSDHDNVRQQPGSKNNSQEWPDFEGEFSEDLDSAEPVLTDDAASADRALPRLVMKRRVQEEAALFSDEDEDESDPKAGVLSQIDRIQTFLKTDRLKRVKKQNKDPVV